MKVLAVALCGRGIPEVLRMRFEEASNWRSDANGATTTVTEIHALSLYKTPVLSSGTTC